MHSTFAYVITGLTELDSKAVGWNWEDSGGGKF